MQIEFKKEQIVKDKPQSILIDYVEYKLSLPKWMIKNNSFIVDNNYTYWVFNSENIKRELNGDELTKLLEPYISEQKITVNKLETPKEYYLNDIKLEPLTFYEQHNSWFIGEITDSKTKITNPCFKYNVTWEENRKGFKLNNPYNHNDLSINYIVTSYKHISTHNEKIFYL
ncbi:hypothetical protein [Spiroplasma ixodetis]|uniref:Uncharacterized protein n=1 Tax=Spiroplasma ixodetis TaxID=2141 RepID=A0ABN6T0Z6_9MOLU|nr:hypothetical protein [Spiroplasma ixodetis]BDT03501.1 hypothetical protein SHM_11470 [Spiroplasma ixodetis]BDT04647.1 hypothetical protein SHM_22930 [Spiroplasma ixodetis]